MAGYKYTSIAVGGTFDHIHTGHRALLKRAFDTSEFVVIGLTSDVFAASEGKVVEHDFEYRRLQLLEYLTNAYPDRQYLITKLDTKFGQGIFTKDIEAIVVSSETSHSVKAANRKRSEIGLAELKIEIVPLVVAEDGKKISSTRIRAGEIDKEGKVV